jgi:hypothetical protein
MNKNSWHTFSKLGTYSQNSTEQTTTSKKERTTLLSSPRLCSLTGTSLPSLAAAATAPATKCGPQPPPLSPLDARCCRNDHWGACKCQRQWHNKRQRRNERLRRQQIGGGGVSRGNAATSRTRIMREGGEGSRMDT